jgi:hypothetical protein
MAIWQPQGTRDVASLWPKRRHLARTLTGIARPSLAARGLLAALCNISDRRQTRRLLGRKVAEGQAALALVPQRVGQESVAPMACD